MALLTSVLKEKIRKLILTVIFTCLHRSVVQSRLYICLQEDKQLEEVLFVALYFPAVKIEYKTYDLIL